MLLTSLHSFQKDTLLVETTRFLYFPLKWEVYFKHFFSFNLHYKVS
ncbi:hypothetical protein HMPREF1345_01538 [Enterococcus faecium TX1337RF]|nr:hypothetical protein HMPREF1345_01538 [Enterococcus faecium TX1337RF]